VGLGDVECVLAAGVLGGGESVGQALLGGTRGVEVVGQLEDTLGIDRLDVFSRPQMEPGSFLGGKAVEESLTELVWVN
jgi:hypothetical protein